MEKTRLGLKPTEQTRQMPYEAQDSIILRLLPWEEAASEGEPDIVRNYDASLFVPPTAAYSWVITKVRKGKGAQLAGLSTAKVWRAGLRSYPPSPGDQVLYLTGERGVGKTWLLQHLALRDDLVSAAAMYLDLDQRTEFSNPKDYVETVRDQVRRKVGRAGRILLLDHVPSHLDDHLRELEDVVLRPHLAGYGALVIMALIHPARVCWRAPTLRGGDNHWLLPFEQPQTQAQLQQLEGAGLFRHRLATSAVQDYSGGLPLLNHLLAQQERRRAFELFLDHCFSRVPAGERDPVRGYLEAVCVLDVLEHAAVERALEVYHRHHPQGNGYPASAGEVRNALRQYWFARSAPDVPGHIILVESARRATREVLKVRDPQRYVAMNEAAHSLRGEWR